MVVWASASSDSESTAAGTVKLNAAASPRRENVFRREIVAYENIATKQRLAKTAMSKLKQKDAVKARWKMM